MMMWTKADLTLIWVATPGIANAIPHKKRRYMMEEYIGSIRSNAMTVNELITFLRQFDGTSTIGIGTEIGQIDIYEDENGDLIFR